MSVTSLLPVLVSRFKKKKAKKRYRKLGFVLDDKMGLVVDYRVTITKLKWWGWRAKLRHFSHHDMQ